MMNRMKPSYRRIEECALYTEQDYQDICAQARRRWIALLIPCALLFCGVIACFGWREQINQWLGAPASSETAQHLALGLTALAGVVFVFCQGVFISPVLCYRRHLDGVLHQRTRQTTGAFKQMELAPVTRDGVRFYPFLINVGKMTDEEDDRLFFWDVTLPIPNWQPGQKITVTAHDKALGAWEYAES